MSKRYSLAAMAFITAFISFAVYIPALDNGFVNWDDPVYFFDNPHIRDFGWDFLKWVNTAVVSNNWHPLTMLSHAIDFWLFGATPFGPHLINSVLHSINTALVAIITFRLIGFAAKEREPRFSLGAAFITALLFAVHPLHVESVAWISERKDLLCALFYMLSLLSYLGFNTGNSKRLSRYLKALFFMLLALLSKPMAITLPLALIIIDFYPLERLGGRRADKLGGSCWKKFPSSHYQLYLS